jgi:hypothetical protein
MAARFIAPLLAATLLAGPVLATEEEDRPEADAAYDYGFVDAFAKACVPQRLSFEGTKAQAVSEGWTAVAADTDPELAKMMQHAQAAAVDPEYPDWRTAFETYGKTVGSRPLHLVVTHLIAPDVINLIGCYLYDFGMERMIDPANVTALLSGQEIASSIDEQGLVGYTWGPPCAMPRLFDTYLTLIKPDSPHLEKTGFSGLMLKFETSEPAPGEDVPETYC